MSTSWTNILYLVRHGENLANLTKEFSYKRVDYSLTAKGVLQAEQTADFFKTQAIDAVYTSPLKRARETAEIIARPHGLPVIVREAFREINVGDLELMPPDEATWKLHDRVLRTWLPGRPGARFPGGENCYELIERARRGLREITTGRAGQRIVLASHGGILTEIVRTLCASTGPDLVRSDMPNCAISEIELTTHKQAKITGSLRTWARVTHLSGEAAEQVSPVLAYEQT
jgi:broad specificity phosphatase PhoE